MKNRDPFIDVLKSIAIILIIITHDPYFVEHYTAPVCVYFIDMAVPVFMFISGHNYAKSVINHSYKAKDLYKPSIILNRLLRFLIPYTLVFVMIATLLTIFKDKSYSINILLCDYIKGGYGPGSYYTTIMIQFVIIVPLMYIFISKQKKKGLFVAFLLNAMYEVLFTYFSPHIDYARIIMRYIFIISCGIYYSVCHNNQKISNRKSLLLSILSFTIGISYLTYTQYISQPHLFTRWTTTSMIVTFYIIPILTLAKILYYRYFDSKTPLIIVYVSSATYHIYLTQMIYYYTGIHRFLNVPTSIRILISISICLTCGIVFYVINKAIHLKLRESVFTQSHSL